MCDSPSLFIQIAFVPFLLDFSYSTLNFKSTTTYPYCHYNIQHVVISLFYLLVTHMYTRDMIIERSYVRKNELYIETLAIILIYKIVIRFSLMLIFSLHFRLIQVYRAKSTRQNESKPWNKSIGIVVPSPN